MWRLRIACSRLCSLSYSSRKLKIGGILILLNYHLVKAFKWWSRTIGSHVCWIYSNYWLRLISGVFRERNSYSVILRFRLRDNVEDVTRYCQWADLRANFNGITCILWNRGPGNSGYLHDIFLWILFEEVSSVSRRLEINKWWKDDAQQVDTTNGPDSLILFVDFGNKIVGWQLSCARTLFRPVLFKSQTSDVAARQFIHFFYFFFFMADNNTADSESPILRKDTVVHHYHHEPEAQERLQRVVMVSLDETSGRGVFNWAMENFIRPETDMVWMIVSVLYAQTDIYIGDSGACSSSGRPHCSLH